MLGAVQDVFAPALARLGVAAAAVLLAASIAVAQQPATPSAPQVLQPPAETIGAIGRLLGAGVKGAGETLGGATSAAGELAKGVGDAAGAVARLPLSNVVAGRETCALAANGAPDCAAASLALCRSKGFARGASLDITAARKCPAAVWLEGREPTDAECTNEAFVSRAICQ